MKRRPSSPPPSSKRRAFSPPLPPGWSRWHDKTGRPYFINEEDGSTTWEDPRAPVAVARHREAPPRRSAHSYSPPPARGAQQAFPERLDRDRESPVQLHVSGIDEGIKEGDVRQFFGAWEQYITRYLRIKEGYCFLHFGDNLGAALAASAELDGHRLLGRVVRVRPTKSTAEQFGIPEGPPTVPRTPLEASLPPPIQYLPAVPPLMGAAPTSVQIHVSGLAPGTTEEDLKEFFRSFRGKLGKIHCKSQMGYAFVHLDNIGAARAAIEKLSGKTDKYGQRLKLELSTNDALRFGPNAPPRQESGRKGKEGRNRPPADHSKRPADHGIPEEEVIQLFVGGLGPEVTNDDIWACFSDCPVLKVHRVKDSHCFIHLPDINTALDVMRDKEGSKCASHIIKVSLSTAACKRYGVPARPHRKPQLLLQGMPLDATIEDVRVFLDEQSGHIEEIAPTETPGEWTLVASGVPEALACYEFLDGKYFLGNNVEVRLSDASSRCLNMPPKPDKQTS